MQTIFIVTEANEYVATGHLMECIICAEELNNRGYIVSFWINNDAKDNLKKRIPCPYQEYEKTIEEDYGYFEKQIGMKRPKVVIFNLRKISKKFLEEIKCSFIDNIKLICIDEFGHRNLAADVIINPMIEPCYWDYGDSRARLYCGAKYLILSQELAKLHLKNKGINNDIKNVLITMGGVDPKNYTSDLIEIIPHAFGDSNVNIVIGGGNQNQEEIREKSAIYKNIKLYENITNLLQMMFEADLLLCAGGNTLHEAACVGTPAMIIPSMPHENMTARYFEKKGFGYVIDIEKDFCNEVLNKCLRLKNIRNRKRMSEKGKLFSDGLGWKRVIEIIENEI